jgi:hypothetical protein
MKKLLLALLVLVGVSYSVQGQTNAQTNTVVSPDTNTFPYRLPIGNGEKITNSLMNLFLKQGAITWVLQNTNLYAPGVHGYYVQKFVYVGGYAQQINPPPATLEDVIGYIQPHTDEVIQLVASSSTNYDMNMEFVLYIDLSAVDDSGVPTATCLGSEKHFYYHTNETGNWIADPSAYNRPNFHTTPQFLVTTTDVGITKCWVTETPSQKYPWSQVWDSDNWWTTYSSYDPVVITNFTGNGLSGGFDFPTNAAYGKFPGDSVVETVTNGVTRFYRYDLADGSLIRTWTVSKPVLEINYAPDLGTSITIHGAPYENYSLIGSTDPIFVSTNSFSISSENKTDSDGKLKVTLDTSTLPMAFYRVVPNATGTSIQSYKQFLDLHRAHP